MMMMENIQRRLTLPRRQLSSDTRWFSLSLMMLMILIALCTRQNPVGVGTAVVTAFSPLPSRRYWHGQQRRSTDDVRTTARFVLQERLSGEEINRRLQDQLAVLRAKDRKSKALTAKDLKVVYEDEHIVVVDKPSGVLCVPSEDGVPSLAQTVFDYCSTTSGNGLAKPEQMVVHRLGMDTSGLIVFCKTLDGVRGMNSLFRTRKITRQYEALVAGHVAKDQGLINLPLMRDYEHPPFMRVSTEEHQAALVDLDPDLVGKKLLESPKASLTHYQVMDRETFLDGSKGDWPVTRLTLTSITGRTHQLNVHCAAFGHPIVSDAIYGWEGYAAPAGGLDAAALQETAPDGASADLQKGLAEAARGRNMCVHAKLVKFRHPVTKEEMEFTSAAPF